MVTDDDDEQYDNDGLTVMYDDTVRCDGYGYVMSVSDYGVRGVRTVMLSMTRYGVCCTTVTVGDDDGATV